MLLLLLHNIVIYTSSSAWFVRIENTELIRETIVHYKNTKKVNMDNNTTPYRRKNSLIDENLLNNLKISLEKRISSASENDVKTVDIDELRSLPNESSNVYSYNPLSPNSLTVRLNILKRALELLISNPDMLREPKTDKPLDNFGLNDSHIQSNAHSAAINAFVNNSSGISSPLAPPLQSPFIPRTRQKSASFSLLSQQTTQETELRPPGPISSFYKNTEFSSSTELINSQKSDLEDLLDFLNQTLENSTSSEATDLHNLSLLNINRQGQKLRTSHLLKTLLDSLSEPFIQQQVVNNPRNFFTSINKNVSSQAIITCSSDFPWTFKSANDVACHKFGISKESMKALTLLDLIHPDSRNFVLERLMDSVSSKVCRIFVGDVIPCRVRGGINFMSVWMKKVEEQGGMLVCAFENVPCDFVDVKLKLNDTFDLESVIDDSGLFSLVDNNRNETETSINNIDTISKSLGTAIKEQNQAAKEHNVQHERIAVQISEKINSIRYFTLNHLSYNIPCAITSSILHNSLKMKMHSLPYQAGLFILDTSTSDFNLISFNRTISKNLFGYHYNQLINKSVKTIIPCFPELMYFIHQTYTHIDINSPSSNGLVLTEHFFRKAQSEMVNEPEKFYTSVGIDGKHRDGCPIKIDIQLRVINPNVCILWLTHSRDVVFKNYKIVPTEVEVVEKDQISPEARWLQEKKDETNITSIERHKTPSSGSESPSIELETGKSDTTATESDIDSWKHNLELTKKFANDKSQFVKKDNFKLDEDLIKKMTSEKKSGSYTNLIGAQKRVKKFSDFVSLQKLGEGAYGKVHLCMNKLTKEVVIIKLIFKERILVDTWVRDRKLGTIPSEIHIMSMFNEDLHENVPTLIDFFEDDEYYYIEMPPHGETGSIDLFDLIEFKSDMTELEAKLIFKQVISAIKYLHGKNIVHRDIKDENVIVDSKGFVKLIDYGSAADVKSGPFDVFVGTIDYAAPEVLGGKSYAGKPQDIWALGILLYTIMFKENPFYNVDEILDGELRFGDEDVSDDCIDLIKFFLNRSVEDRPTIDEIAKHRWLQL